MSSPHATADKITRTGPPEAPAQNGGTYQCVPRLQEELRNRFGSWVVGKWLPKLAKTEVLVFAEWAIGALGSVKRSDLLEIIDHRAGSKATNHHQPLAG